MGNFLIIKLIAQSPASLALVILITVVSLAAFYKRNLFASLIIYPHDIVYNKEYYRLVTADFVHNDMIHLMINIFMLYVFGTNLEEEAILHSHYGSLEFLLIYFAGMLSGAVFVTLRHRNDMTYSSAGPSGSILGCMFGFMLLDPADSSMYLPVFGEVKNSYCVLLYILFLIIYKIRTKNHMINYDIHFVGGLGGLLATYLIFFI